MNGKSRIAMFGKANFKNSSVWKSLNPDFQCLENPKLRIPVFKIGEIQNYNVWKSQTLKFQCLEKPKFGIRMIGEVLI